MAKHLQTGLYGEQLAFIYFRDKGFSVLHRNWRYSYYEIDIIAEKDKVLHFIEIKTRNNNHFGRPEESVSNKKMKRMMKAAEEFQSIYPEYQSVQYDILSIHLKGSMAMYFFIEDVYL